jgi:hypothetical protein
MTQPLFSLAYFSRNAINGGADEMRSEIGAILASARRNNVRHGVTGALLFSDGCFAQVLEGGREDIELVFETIQCDPRHSNVTIMHLHEVTERSFGDWSMAFGGIDGVSVDPQINAEGMGPVDGLLTVPAGANLLAALRSVVHRDDLARRDELAAP